MDKRRIETMFKMEKVKQDSKAARLKRMVRFRREILPSLDAYGVRAFNRSTMFKFVDDRWGGDRRLPDGRQAVRDRGPRVGEGGKKMDN